MRQALALTERTRPDVALLDIMLPDGDGRALGRELRARQPDLALVFLTARDAPAEVVGALGFSDDYITKPFNIDEVIARIRAVLRRTRATDVPAAAAPADLRRPGTGRGDVHRPPGRPHRAADPDRVRAAPLPRAQRRSGRPQRTTPAPRAAVRARGHRRVDGRRARTSAICGANSTRSARR